MEHFLPHNIPCTRDVRIWRMLRHGQGVRSQTDYILGADCHLFQNVAVQDPRQNTNHYMVLGCLRSVTLREHQCYIRSRMRLPLYSPNHPSHLDTILAPLRQAMPKTLTCKHVHSSWISEETCWFISTRVSLWRSAYRCHQRVCALGRQVQSLMNKEQ